MNANGNNVISSCFTKIGLTELRKEHICAKKNYSSNSGYFPVFLYP